MEARERKPFHLSSIIAMQETSRSDGASGIMLGVVCLILVSLCVGVSLMTGMEGGTIGAEVLWAFDKKYRWCEE